MDSGACIYVDNDVGTATEKLVNRIVEVNLESFCIEKVDPIDFSENPGFYPILNAETINEYPINNFYFAVKKANGSEFVISGTESYLYGIE